MLVMIVLILVAAGIAGFLTASREKEFTISGIISHIVAEGDHYIATLRTDNGKEYITVSSTIAIQKKIVMLSDAEKVTIKGNMLLGTNNNIQVTDIVKSE